MAMTPVTPKITLSTPRRGSSPPPVDRRQGQGLQQLVRVVGMRCDSSRWPCAPGSRRRGVDGRRPYAGSRWIGCRWTRNALPVRFGTVQDDARSRRRGGQREGGWQGHGPDRYGGSRPSAQRSTVVEMAARIKPGRRPLCSGRDTRHAGAADRLGWPGCCRPRPPPARHGAGCGQPSRRRRTSAAPRPAHPGPGEDVLRGSASSFPRAVPPGPRANRRRGRRGRQPEGRRGQDHLGRLAGRGVRRARQAGPAGRPGRPGVPDLQPRRRPGRGGDEHQRGAARQGGRGRGRDRVRGRGGPAAERRSSWPEPRRSCCRARAASTSCAPPWSRCSTRTTSCCWTARRPSAC